MVFFKIGNGTSQEIEVEIVNEAGTWESGSYRIFKISPQEKNNVNLQEPQNLDSPDFLGELVVDKLKGTWTYDGDQLNPDDQKEVAGFILDYRAPDGVY